jgi:hypothetical protein
LREDGDLVLVCDDFNLTEVAWSHQDDELCPLNEKLRENCQVDSTHFVSAADFYLFQEN